MRDNVNNLKLRTEMIIGLILGFISPVDMHSRIQQKISWPALDPPH